MLTAVFTHIFALVLLLMVDIQFLECIVPKDCWTSLPVALPVLLFYDLLAVLVFRRFPSPSWWYSQRKEYPTLYRLARDILAIPGKSVVHAHKPS